MSFELSVKKRKRQLEITTPKDSSKETGYLGSGQIDRSDIGSESHMALRFSRGKENQAVHCLVKERIQSKLKVDDSDGEYERKADRVTKQVMRMPAPKPMLAEQPSDSGSSASVRIQRMCPRCRQRYQQEKPFNWEECEEELRRKMDGNSTSAVEAVEQTVSATREPSQPLSPSTRSFFENRIGSEFSGVRIHTRLPSVPSRRHLGETND